MTIVRAASRRSTTWSGGQTSELALYPTQSSYANRDFIFRISTAKVDIPSSEFTSLPGYHRSLMILEGKVKLTHRDHHEIVLGPYQLDEFEGEWQTNCEGTATDFNVMTSHQATHRVRFRTSDCEEIISLENPTLLDAVAIFIIKGVAHLPLPETELSTGDFIILYPGVRTKLCLKFKEGSEWIMVDLKLKGD